MYKLIIKNAVNARQDDVLTLSSLSSLSLSIYENRTIVAISSYVHERVSCVYVKYFFPQSVFLKERKKQNFFVQLLRVQLYLMASTKNVRPFSSFLVIATIVTAIVLLSCSTSALRCYTTHIHNLIAKNRAAAKAEVAWAQGVHHQVTP